MSIRKKSEAVKSLENLLGEELTFCDLLLSIRTTDEITQAVLAKKAGTTKAKICDFEKGRRVPSLKLAAKLAKALGHSEALFVSKIIEEQIREANLKLKINVEAA